MINRRALRDEGRNHHASMDPVLGAQVDAAPQDRDLMAEAFSDLGSANHRFRADTDQSGHWFVWERFGTNGWAATRPCSTRLDAERLASELNATSEIIGD